MTADLSASDSGQQTLRVHVQRGSNTWCGSITNNEKDPSETRTGSNCAATRGTVPSARTFALLRTGTNKERSVQIVGDMKPRLIVSSVWGSEFGVRGFYLPVSEIQLDDVDSSDFYAALFGQVANHRDEEQKLHTSIKRLESETDVLRRTDESLTIIILKRREQLLRTMKQALNELKIECQTTV